MTGFRQSTQSPAPARHGPPGAGEYDIYPSFPLGPGKIGLGFESLADAIIASGRPHVIIDGYIGVLWERFAANLARALEGRGRSVRLQPAGRMKPPEEIDRLIEPFLGGDDPLFGRRCQLTLDALFAGFTPLQESEGITIIYGVGAALQYTLAPEIVSSLRNAPRNDVSLRAQDPASLRAPFAKHDLGVPPQAGQSPLLLYVDVPKCEAQFRSRAGSFANLGAAAPLPPKVMYKRMYFVDWPVLNRHRARILPAIDIMIDEQRPEEPAFMKGSDFRDGLDAMGRNYFRVRPWFEPGPWGGQWIKSHVPSVEQHTPNYAWSFELISPENGIAFESDGVLLEASFDFLMFRSHKQVLGAFADAFGYEFPIRYDFLDTFGGGNLSLQCHPRPEYIHRNFGETFTQDEAYYIIDCRPGARVFLGFRDDIDPAAFRRDLERSARDGTPVDVERHVNTVGARAHDLFLIPGGTIHCSGIDNLVLEISSTPYIFTFKMYDWMRTDLDGTPRTLNIARAFDNLAFERRGRRVGEELVSHPVVEAEGDGWKIVHLPTHPDHLYDVHRFDLTGTVSVATNGSCHVMNLVEGEWVLLETAGGMRARFNYAETFIVPAAAGSFRLTNGGSRPAKVVATFLKPGAKPYAKPEGAI